MRMKAAEREAGGQSASGSDCGRQDERKGPHSFIHRYFGDAGQAGRDPVDQHRHTPPGEETGDPTARQRQDERLRDQLPRDSGAAAAQRQARGKFLATARSMSQ